MPPRSPWRRIALALAALLGVAVALVAVLALLLGSSAVTGRVTDLVLPRASAALGRDVTMAGARLALFPNPRVGLSRLAVAGRPGEPPLVEAESLDVEVGLWPLLRSLGKEIDVRSVVLVRPAVNLVRARDGSWSYEGLGAKPEARPGARPGGARPPPPPPTPAGPPEAAPAVAVRSLRIDGAAIRVIDRSGGKEEASLALRDLDLRADGIGPGLPFDLHLSAALASDAQDVHAELSVDRLPAAVPARAEDWPKVQGTLRIAGLSLERLRALLPGAFGQVVRGGKVSLDARVSTAEGSYRVEGGGELADLLLRGQPASGRFRAAAVVPPARPGAAHLDLAELAVRGPGIDLGGHASVDLSPLRATFVLSGPLLDVDAVMGVLPPSPAAPAKPPAGGPEPAKAAGSSAAPEGGPVPAGMRREVEAASAHGTIAVQTLKAGRIAASDVRAQATLKGGVLTLEQLEAGVLGGRVSAGGTRVVLTQAEPTWKLAAKLSGIDLAAATKAFSSSAPLEGKLDGTLDVSGAGTQWEQLRDGLTGQTSLGVKEGALTTADLGGEVLGRVSAALQALAKAGVAGKVASGAKRTPIKDLSGDFLVKDGFLTTKAPFAFQAPFGKVSLGGRIGLDERLDLSGTAAVPGSVLKGVAGGIPLPATVDVPISIGGTLHAPSVGVKSDALASSLLKKGAGEALRGKAERAGKDLLKKLGVTR